MTTKTATYIVRLYAFNGDARLYRCDPAMPYENGRHMTDHVVVSALHPPHDLVEPETYIFPADATGEVTGWAELPGSFRGDMDHAAALRGAGYEVVGDPS